MAVHFVRPLIIGYLICLVYVFCLCSFFSIPNLNVFGYSQYGISVSQAYIYIFASGQDSKILRYTVMIVL